MARVRADRPDVIINCAAYNNVDRAEEEPDKALNANAFAVRVLARAAQETGATLVHYSTDFVFDGHTDRPYVEDGSAESAKRVRPVEIARRVFCAGGAACLRAARREPVRRPECRRARSIASRRPLLKAARRRCFAIASCRRVTSWTSRRQTRALLARGEPGLYHCVGTGHANWYEVGAGDRARDGERAGRAPAADVGRRRVASRAASAVRGACQRQVESRRLRCLRGRMRCGDI